MFSRITFQKRSKFGYYSRFPSFRSLEQNFWTLVVLYNTEMQIEFLSSSSFFINLEEEVSVLSN